MDEDINLISSNENNYDTDTLSNIETILMDPSILQTSTNPFSQPQNTLDDEFLVQSPRTALECILFESRDLNADEDGGLIMRPNIYHIYSELGTPICLIKEYVSVFCGDSYCSIIYQVLNHQAIYPLNILRDAITVYINFQDVTANCHYCHNEINVFNHSLCDKYNNSWFICDNCSQNEQLCESDVTGYYNIPCLTCSNGHIVPLYRFIRFNKIKRQYVFDICCPSCFCE